MHQLTLVALLAVTGITSAQTPLQLDVTGGSVPGTIDIDVYPGPLFEGVGVLISTNAGSTPIALLDPNDPRSVQLALPFAKASTWGFMGIDNHFRPNQLTIANNPAFLGMQAFFQAVTFPGQSTLIDRISLPRAMFFGPSGQFVDPRLVSFMNARAFHSVLPRGDGTWMVSGGGVGALLAQVASDNSEVYDPMTDSFGPGPNLTVDRAVHTTTRLADGRYLLAAGVDVQNDPQATCEIWDPSTGVFAPTGSLSKARMGHSATLLPDGRVLVAGGLESLTAPTAIEVLFSALASTEIYDPVAGTWSPGPNMTTPRAGHVAFMLARLSDSPSRSGWSTTWTGGRGLAADKRRRTGGRGPWPRGRRRGRWPENPVSPATRP